MKWKVCRWVCASVYALARGQIHEPTTFHKGYEHVFEDSKAGTTHDKKEITWRKVKAATVVVSALAIATFVAKMVLLTARYLARVGSHTCDKYQRKINNAFENGSTPTTVHPNEDIELDGVFTVTVYTLLSLLRVVEYSFLSYGLITFVWRCSRDSNIVENLKRVMNQKLCHLPVLLCIVVILTPYLILGTVIVPTFGILQEIVHTKKVNCDKDIGKVYIAYCSVNVLRYTWDFSVRVGMIVTTLVVGKVWSPVNAANDPSTLESESGTIQEGELHVMITDRLVHDLHKTDTYVKTLENTYHENGKLVQSCNEIFQTWFILPWVIYFIASSLEVGNVLLPWKDDKETFTSIYPKLYYLAYNINQLITLVVPYLCAKRMEAYHKQYFESMEAQISSKKFGNMMKISKIGYYDFCPRLIGTDIMVDISSPLYFLFLLVGFFFTMCKTLL